MDTSLFIAMILVSALLIVVVLLQTKGSSFTGSFSSDSNTIASTRRGFEKTLFHFTIVLSVVWALLAITLSLVVD